MEKNNKELQEKKNNQISEDINKINSINEDNFLLLGMSKLNENKNENENIINSSNNKLNTNNIKIENFGNFNAGKKNSCLTISATWGIWIYSIGSFYPIVVHIFVFILFFLGLFFMPIPYLNS